MVRTLIRDAMIVSVDDRIGELQAILAFLQPDEAEAIIEGNAPLYGRYNGLNADKIRSRLPQVRAQRYALDHGELVAGISALAIQMLPLGWDAIASIAINMTSARPARHSPTDSPRLD